MQKKSRRVNVVLDSDLFMALGIHCQKRSTNKRAFIIKILKEHLKEELENVRK